MPKGGVERMRRTPSNSTNVGRGVWVAPWMGPNGELVVVAVSRRNRLLAERIIAPGDNSDAIGQELWAIVERDDPLDIFQVI